MKTILVTAGGSTTDRAVFATALAAARPLAAHLEFFHVRITAEEAALFTPHVEFARGPAIRDAIARLRDEEITRSAAALLHFRTLCKEENIEVVDVPSAKKRLSASWREETNSAESRLMLRARHNDLVVIARPTRANGMPADLLETLLVGCGRPILIAPAKAPESVSRTVMVCWKETPEAARRLPRRCRCSPRPSACSSPPWSSAGSPPARRSPISPARWHGTASTPSRSSWITMAGRRHSSSPPKPRRAVPTSW